MQDSWRHSHTHAHTRTHIQEQSSHPKLHKLWRDKPNKPYNEILRETITKEDFRVKFVPQKINLNLCQVDPP